MAWHGKASQPASQSVRHHSPALLTAAATAFATPATFPVITRLWLQNNV